jgi:hypothetical protein
MNDNKKTIKAEFSKLDAIRTEVLTRARRCTLLTLPYVLPPQGHTESSKLYKPWQSCGSTCVKSLANKILNILFPPPPNSTFFKFKVSDPVKKALISELGNDTDIEQFFAACENTVIDELEMKAIRAPLLETIIALIVTGNSLIYLPDKSALEYLVDKKGMQVFRLDQYVVKRDTMGNPFKIITTENVAKTLLPESILTQLEEAKDKKDCEEVELYTKCERKGNKWYVTQEVNGIEIPESKGSYNLENFPYIPLRANAIPGEDYGRGPVEEHIGDFNSVEVLEKAIIQYTAAISKFNPLVDPDSGINIKELIEAPSGKPIMGKANGINVPKLTDYSTFQVAQTEKQELEKRLYSAFMVMQSIQRDGERVTATEIVKLSQELEANRGGFYSILVQELQTPIVNLIISQLRDAGDPLLSKFSSKVARPVIITGLEAMGRMNDLQKLGTFLDITSKVPGATDRLKTDNLLTQIMTALGVSGDLVKTEKDIQQEMQQAALMQAAQASAPGAIREYTKAMMNTPQPPQQPQESEPVE